MNVKSLVIDKNSLLIHYLVTEETLYAFVLSEQGLQLFRRKIGIDELQGNVNLYKSYINQTIAVLGKYDSEKDARHFLVTKSLSHELSKKLLLQQILTKFETSELNCIYVIPDEFLYELAFTTMVVDTGGSYLIEKSAIVNLPGASFLNSNLNDVYRPQGRQSRVLISADTRISGVAELKAMVKKIFPLAEELQSGKKPSREAVLNKLGEPYDIYIIVGHGLANIRFPERSYMELLSPTL